ncbi:hypothetical protein JTB14_029216 [Gonioctena quinquepunctata]|nr:hypothetical protein JTB14_029216 [Gonioctena quinquepunctata]
MSSDDPPTLCNVHSLWCVYLVSVAAAWTAELVTYPLDIVKTRLQIQGGTLGAFAKAPKRSMLETAAYIIFRNTHVLYRELKKWFIKQFPDQTSFPLWQSAICAVAAGGISQLLASPVDLIKVQMQMEGKRRLIGLSPRVSGVSDAIHKTWAVGGMRALWKGWSPNVQRAALVSLGDISAYDVSKRWIQRQYGLPDDTSLHILSSTFTAFVIAALSTPADVIKSRVMNQRVDRYGNGTLYSSTADCLEKTVQDEGLKALYKGFMPTWMKLVSWSLTFWVTYENISVEIGGNTF